MPNLLTPELLKYLRKDWHKDATSEFLESLRYTAAVYRRALEIAGVDYQEASYPESPGPADYATEAIARWLRESEAEWEEAHK